MIIFDGYTHIQSFNYYKLKYLFTISTAGILIEPGHYTLGVGQYKFVGDLVHQKLYSGFIILDAEPGKTYRISSLTNQEGKEFPSFLLFEETDLQRKKLGEFIDLKDF